MITKSILTTFVTKTYHGALMFYYALKNYVSPKKSTFIIYALKGCRSQLIPISTLNFTLFKLIFIGFFKRYCSVPMFVLNNERRMTKIHLEKIKNFNLFLH